MLPAIAPILWKMFCDPFRSLGDHEERKKYLRQINRNKVLIVLTRLAIVILFIAVWEILANVWLYDRKLSDHEAPFAGKRSDRPGGIHHHRMLCLWSVSYTHLNIIGTFFGVLSLSTIQNIVSSAGLDQAWWTVGNV